MMLIKTQLSTFPAVRKNIAHISQAAVLSNVLEIGVHYSNYYSPKCVVYYLFCSFGVFSACVIVRTIQHIIHDLQSYLFISDNNH